MRRADSLGSRVCTTRKLPQVIRGHSNLFAHTISVAEKAVSDQKA